MFSLGLFTIFICSDYGMLLFWLKSALLKPVTTGKEGEEAEGSSEELSSSLMAWLCSSRCAFGCYLAPLGLCPFSSLRGTAQAMGMGGKQQKAWAMIKILAKYPGHRIRILRNRNEALELFQPLSENNNLLISRIGQVELQPPCTSNRRPRLLSSLRC